MTLWQWRSATRVAQPSPAIAAARRRGPLLVSAAAFSLGAAAIYLVVLPAQPQANLLEGVVSAVVGIAQVALAVALLAGPTRRRLVAATAASLVVIAVWVLARTTGLPGPNPWLPLDTAVGFTDFLCLALEVLAAVLLGWAALRWPRILVPRVHRPVLVVVASVPPLLLALLLTLAGVAFATDGFTTVTHAGGSVPASLPAGRMTTVTYCRQQGVKLAMDVYEPVAGAARPAPAVLYVHGGGFVFGNRRPNGLLANHGGALFPELRAGLTQRGMVVASIDYRLLPLSPWPAALEDAKCAVRFLRANATALGIDPGRIGAWGSSAGGALVSLLGVVGPQAGFDRGPYADQSSTLQAAVDMFGAADLTDLHDSTPFMRMVIQVALGSSPRVRRAASPISYLGAGANAAAAAVGGIPPFLILQGSDDQGVLPRHSQTFADQLHAAGVPARLVLVRGADHGLDNPSQQPTPVQVTKLVLDFFTQTLARSDRA